MTAAARARAFFEGGSGPLVARAFQVLLGLVAIDAFASLLVQIRVLVGSRGLLPIAELVRVAELRGVPKSALPMVFWWWHSDAALVTACVVGIVLGALAVAGILPRVAFGLAWLDYLGLVVACQTFCGFQWDILLCECLVLALFLPTDRPAPLAHWLFRLLVFKLYFESGIAKWQSHLHDWQDGSAMTFYYETAPIPGPLAWAAHHLPAWWHHLESRLVLVLELPLAFLFLGPRPARLTAFFLFTAFQLANLATANYGFFVYLACALHVFALDDADLARAAAFLRRRAARVVSFWDAFRRARSRVLPLPRPRVPKRFAVIATALFAVFWTFASLVEAKDAFGTEVLGSTVSSLRELWVRTRAVNVYHLFGHITRTRIEPEFQALVGGEWVPLDLRYEPGDPKRPLPLVAPHQPRVDFQLWFYGLAYQIGTPRWVATLVERLCDDPSAVQSLFAAPLPPSPEAIRIAFFRYGLTTPEERRATGAIWDRAPLGTSGARRCSP